MALIRLKAAQVPIIRTAILQKRQGGKCPLCQRSISPTGGFACLDHDHVTGLIRGTLCRNCNGIEGKIKNLAVRGRASLSLMTYLRNIVAYWDLHSTDQTGLLYPTHKTDDEKRVLRNTKARKKRAATKKVK